MSLWASLQNNPPFSGSSDWICLKTWVCLKIVPSASLQNQLNKQVPLASPSKPKPQTVPFPFSTQTASNLTRLHSCSTLQAPSVHKPSGARTASRAGAASDGTTRARRAASAARRRPRASETQKVAEASWKSCLFPFKTQTTSFSSQPPQPPQKNPPQKKKRKRGALNKKLKRKPAVGFVPLKPTERYLQKVDQEGNRPENPSFGGS